LEARQRELVLELENSGGKAFELNRELAGLQERLSSVMEEWETLSASLPAAEEEKEESAESLISSSISNL
jgi:hypothetical protein